jgi:hypothetical protein
MKKNYFVSKADVCAHRRELLDMGAPTSLVFADYYLQFLEHKELCDILNKHYNTDYLWYANDIPIAYNGTKRH